MTFFTDGANPFKIYQDQKFIIEFFNILRISQIHMKIRSVDADSAHNKFKIIHHRFVNQD
jgi:hypothetical protein